MTEPTTPVETEVPPPAPEEHGGVPDELVRAVTEALGEGAIERAVALVQALHAADQAQLLNQIDATQRTALIEALRGRLDAEEIGRAHV